MLGAVVLRAFGNDVFADCFRFLRNDVGVFGQIVGRVFDHRRRLTRYRGVGAGRERQPNRLFIVAGFADAHDAKAAEAVEAALAGVGRQGRQIDRDHHVSALDRPVDGLAGPGVPAAQKIGDDVIGVEIEDPRHIREAATQNVGSVRAHGLGKFRGKLREGAATINLPDETHGPAVGIEGEIVFRRCGFPLLVCDYFCRRVRSSLNR